MSQWLIQFWKANSGAILISLATGFLFFVLGPLGLWFSGRRIRTERRRRASEALLDLIEDMLVSGETITPSKLATLFRAVERDADVVLEGFYDAETLFEDLTLRFVKSRHLDATQKNKYSEEIKRISDEIAASSEEPTERQIPRAHARIVEDLRQALGNNDIGKANNLTDELERRLLESQSQDGFRSPFRFYVGLIKDHPVIAIATALLVIIFYIFFVAYLIKERKTRQLQSIQTVTSSAHLPIPKEREQMVKMSQSGVNGASLITLSRPNIGLPSRSGF